LQPESVKDNLVRTIFGDGRGLDRDTILKGISHRSAAVRRMTAKLLAEQDALNLETAQLLFSDTDAEVRLVALRVAIEAGRIFSDDEAKGILIKPTATLGVLSLVGGPSDPAGEACWNRFRRERMLAMPLRDLAAAAHTETIFERDAQLALVEREFSSRGNELRAAIDDHFAAEFSNKLNEMARRIGFEHELISKITGFEDSLRKEFTQLEQIPVDFTHSLHA
jgi:hypothetical protein